MFSKGYQRFLGATLRAFKTTPNGGSMHKNGAFLAGGVAAAAGSYLLYKNNVQNKNIMENIIPIKVARAATIPIPQPNVFSQGKDHALYLWIHLKPCHNWKKIGKILSTLPTLVDTVSPPGLRDEDDEVWAGVGFGPDAYTQISGKVPPASFNYPNRKGPLGEMPATGGDVFIHAKSNSVSKLFELAQEVQKALPEGCIQDWSDIYSFVYKNGRDLSGFIDGTENRADDEGRFQVAVNKQTGGSFCMTQVWEHDHKTINSQKDSTLEGWVGRSRNDSTELRRKSASSHVARMTGTELNAKKPVEIVRQSMPFGTVGKESGLFFIAFAEKPYNFDYLLDRMVGRHEDGLPDDIMRLTKCVKGNYWYFPSVEEMKKFS